MSRKLIGAFLLTATASLAYLACGGETTSPPEQPKATAVQLVAGNEQTGTVGQQLATALVVRVNDQNGNPMSGLTVTFNATSGSGSVTAPSVQTGTDGQASTNWVLGTDAAATQQLQASVSGVSAPATFTATATPDVAAVISPDSGDNQQAFRSTKLAEFVVVLVRDQYANGVPTQLVQFTTPDGSGAIDSAAAFTDSTGRARTGWTLGSDVGEDTVQASIQGLTGSPVTFTATAHNLNIGSVSPDPAVWGGTATITGTGFDPVAANNTVTVAGKVATVTAASATQLDVTVPSECLPAGTFDFQVNVGALISVPVSADLQPAAFLSMAVGEQVIVQDPNEFCLQFEETPGAESYLIGVQSTAEAVTSLTSVMLTGASGPGQAVPITAAATPRTSSYVAPLNLVSGRRVERLQRHRAAEGRIWDFNKANWGALRSQSLQASSASRSAAVVDSNVTVGQTILVRVVLPDAITCNEYEEITTVVRAVGEKSIWLEDVANPAGGYTPSHFDAFATRFDDVIYPATVAQFGPTTDADNNARVVMVITKEVNQRGSLGFTNTCDFGPRSADNEASNEGEFFYGEAPDPSGQYGDAFDVEGALAFALNIQAHEFVHVVQIGQRFAVGGLIPVIWIAEGQATLGEETTGHADEGRSTGQNLGLDIVLNADDTTSTDWYSILVTDLAMYFGWDPVSAGDINGRTEGAPHECSFLALGSDNPGPCVGGREAYGTAWSLLRWLSDQIGPTYGGGRGEPGFHQDIITTGTLNGFELLETLVGVSIDSLLAQWAAMLFVDDRLGGSNPTLTMTSWDLADIFDGLIPALHLQPADELFGDFSNAAAVRAASTYYTLLSGANRPSIAVRATDLSNQTLPAIMQLWVVRIQ
jgi:hypothetical protein